MIINSISQQNKISASRPCFGNSEKIFSKLSSEQFYSQVNKSFNSTFVNVKVNQRVKNLPNLLNLLIGTPVQYINGLANSSEFANEYLKMVPTFFKRVHAGKNDIQYRFAYAPEVRMVSDITKSCSAYLNKRILKRTFDSDIEKTLETYSKSFIFRNKSFIA